MTEMTPKHVTYQTIIDSYVRGDLNEPYADFNLAPAVTSETADRLRYVDRRLRYIEAFQAIQQTLDNVQAVEPDFMEVEIAGIDSFAGVVNDSITIVRGQFDEEVERDEPATLGESTIARWAANHQQDDVLNRVLRDEEFDEHSASNMTLACRATVSAVTEGLWAIFQATERLEVSDLDEGSALARQGTAERVRAEFVRIESEMRMAHEGLQAVSDDEQQPQEGNM